MKKGPGALNETKDGECKVKLFALLMPFPAAFDGTLILASGYRTLNGLL